MGGERIRWAEVIDQAARVAAEYGGAVTLRQLYYRLVAAQVIPHTAPTYRRLSARLAAARRQGAFPPLIVDALRRVHVPSCWPDAGTFLAELPALFALDRTTGQPVALYVGAEKDTLRPMFTGWLAEYGIPVLVVRGFGSQSYADQVAAYALPAAEGKAGDPRWPGFAARHGLDPQRPVQWEVEALPPAELRRLLAEAVERRLDRAALEAVTAEEERQRAALADFLARWPQH